jgi:hypothetical protein
MDEFIELVKALSQSMRPKFILAGMMQGDFEACCINKNNIITLDFRIQTDNSYDMIITYNNKMTSTYPVNKEDIELNLSKIGDIVADMRI